MAEKVSVKNMATLDVVSVESDAELIEVESSDKFSDTTSEMMSENEGATSLDYSTDPIEETKEEVIVKNIDAKVPSLENVAATAPICILVLGMAGTGKTTFVQKLVQVAYDQFNPYVINLDPACKETPYFAHIDIRDSVNYKEVMKQYKLGPNGAIVTSLNLFATKFDDVLVQIRKAGENGKKYCIIDTPGQIEVFTWSASGNIITEALGTSFPTFVIYVMDLVRSTSPTTFMSNMMYACSIMYRARLPFLVALNKTDAQDPNFAIEWMQDFDTFEEAMQKESHFVNSLSRTMALTLDKFYSILRLTPVSSKTGAGFHALIASFDECVQEYEKDFKEEFRKMRIEKQRQIKEKMTKPKKHEMVPGEELPLMNDFKKVKKNLDELRLKAPGEDSSEDEEGQEEEPPTFNEDLSDKSFMNFVQRHCNEESKKMDES